MNTENKETNQNNNTSFQDKLAFHFGCEADEVSIEYAAVAVLSELATLREKVKLMSESIKDLRSDLFLQLEPRFGPKFASEYPSIVKSRLDSFGIGQDTKNG